MHKWETWSWWLTCTTWQLVVREDHECVPWLRQCCTDCWCLKQRVHSIYILATRARCAHPTERSVLSTGLWLGRMFYIRPIHSVYLKNHKCVNPMDCLHLAVMPATLWYGLFSNIKLFCLHGLFCESDCLDYIGLNSGWHILLCYITKWEDLDI